MTSHVKTAYEDSSPANTPAVSAVFGGLLRQPQQSEKPGAVIS